MSNHTKESKVKSRYKNADRKDYRRKYRAKHLQLRNWANTKLWAVKQVERTDDLRLTVEQVAEILGVSKSAVYAWINAYKNGGKNAIRSKSKRPKTIYRISIEKETRIVKLKKDTGLGCEKVAIEVPTSCMSAWRYSKKHGLIVPGRFRRRKWKLFERKHANTMWQVDYAELVLGIWTISVLDDHSRFVCAFMVLDHVPTVDDTVLLLEDAFSKFGAPRQIITDHGAQFCSPPKHGISTFDLWCNVNAIHHICASIRKPTTIGKVEAWHRILRQECIDKLADKSIDALRTACTNFVEYYNYHRVHFAYVIYDFFGMKKKRKVWFIPFVRFSTHRRPDDVGDRLDIGR